MTSVSVSVDIAASAEDVWALAGNFDGLPDWLELIRSSRLSDEGRVRHLVAEDGAVIVERLLDHDDANMHYLYTIIEGPDPVTDYMASISLRRIGPRSTSVTWTSRFEPRVPAEADSLAANYGKLYRTGLTRMKVVLEARSR